MRFTFIILIFSSKVVFAISDMPVPAIVSGVLQNIDVLAALCLIGDLAIQHYMFNQGMCFEYSNGRSIFRTTRRQMRKMHAATVQTYQATCTPENPLAN
jgi:hypothetical protein